MKDPDFEFFSNEKYGDFISDFENDWLQYATASEKMKAYFGNVENAIRLFEQWSKDEDVWSLRKQIQWSLGKKSTKN